jgi:hypothetical protein
MLFESRHSPVSTMTRLRAGRSGFDPRQRQGFSLLATASSPALGPTQPPIQWVSAALFLGVKRLGHEADRSPPCSTEVKNAWGYTSTPPYVFMAWCLVKHNDNTSLKGIKHLLTN